MDASPVLDGDGTMETLRLLADEVFVETTGHCSSAQTDAAKQVRRWLWCEVTIQFIRQAKIDDEEDDIVRLCADPTFDPWTFDPDARQPEPEPVPPRPVPLPSRPQPGPIDGSADAASREAMPSNLKVLSSRQELSEFGVRRLMQGNIDGVPVAASVRHVVMLAANPSWARLERARADLRIVAQRHPQVQFIEVSLADTQRHFGTPEHLDQVAWILAASGPTGRAFPEPMVRERLSGSAPDAEQWNKVITHASGFVGAAPPRAIPRPKKPGDLIRAMARHARGSVGRTHSRFQRTTQRHRTRP
ncbi:MAG: hypothetical protein AAF799_45855 [Myxococcota bacterium]